MMDKNKGNWLFTIMYNHAQRQVKLFEDGK